MTELHNMSVPPRSTVTVKRAVIDGRRYYVTLFPRSALSTREHDQLDQALAEHGSLCAAALLGMAGVCPSITSIHRRIAALRRAGGVEARLARECREAVQAAGLPPGHGFFVADDRPDRRGTLSGAAAIAILAARSGPLYLPGRFEPSLIDPRPTTLFFPDAP